MTHAVLLIVGPGRHGLSANTLEILKLVVKDRLTPLVVVPCSVDRLSELLEGVVPEQLASLVGLMQDGLELDVEAHKRHPSSPSGRQELPIPPGYVFSPDYRTVWRLDKMHSLSGPQAQVIALLHKAWADKYIYLHQKYIIDNITTSATRLQDVFKRKADAMQDLLVSDGFGSWALSIPEDK